MSEFICTAPNLWTNLKFIRGKKKISQFPGSREKEKRPDKKKKKKGTEETFQRGKNNLIRRFSPFECFPRLFFGQVRQKARKRLNTVAVKNGPSRRMVVKCPSYKTLLYSLRLTLLRWKELGEDKTSEGYLKSGHQDRERFKYFSVTTDCQ